MGPVTAQMTKALMKGEVFPHLLKSSELYENLQSNHTHNFGAREYGIAGALHTGAAH